MAEVREALRIKKLPSTTEYRPKGTPSHSDSALLSRIAQLEATTKNTEDDMKKLVEAAEERASLAEAIAKKYRKRIKSYVMGSRKRDEPQWGDDSGEETSGEGESSSSSSESE